MWMGYARKSGGGRNSLELLCGDEMRYLKEGVVREGAVAVERAEDWGPGRGAGSQNDKNGEWCPSWLG